MWWWSKYNYKNLVIITESGGPECTIERAQSGSVVGTPHFLKGTIIKGRGLRALREEQTKKNKGRGETVKAIYDG